MTRKIAVCRREHFNAAHRLHNHLLSAAENEQLYGKCNRPNYHGHNYELTVKVTGEIDARTGYVLDTKQLSETIKEHVLDKLDHNNLNLDVPELQGINPTTENLAIAIYNMLRPQIKEPQDLKIILYETERNFVEYPA
ncbi:MAG: 6-carboxytetrahydropterin synthase [Taibaiella sp.]|nr:6-carboxytetrahydropterin synthase [Taibaiella sp.]